jgi:hypothetical protein
VQIDRKAVIGTWAVEHEGLNVYNDGLPATQIAKSDSREYIDRIGEIDSIVSTSESIELQHWAVRDYEAEKNFLTRIKLQEKSHAR